MSDAALRRAIRWFLTRPKTLPVTLGVAHAAALFWLSSIPGRSFGERGEWFGFVSNFAHAPLFGVLGFLVGASLVRRDSRGDLVFGWRRAAAAVTISQAYACADEWHQSMVPGRSSDPRDLVTDLLGVLAAVLIVNGVVAARSTVTIGRGVGLLAGLACVSAWFAYRH